MYVYGSSLGFLEWVLVGCTVLMLLYSQLVGAPGAVNMHYFVRKLLSAIHTFSFIHSYSVGLFRFSSMVSTQAVCLRSFRSHRPMPVLLNCSIKRFRHNWLSITQWETEHTLEIRVKSVCYKPGRNAHYTYSLLTMSAFAYMPSVYLTHI